MNKVELLDAELIHALEKELPSRDPDDARWANLNADLMFKAANCLRARNAELAELRKVVERVKEVRDLLLTDFSAVHNERQSIADGLTEALAPAQKEAPCTKDLGHLGECAVEKRCPSVKSADATEARRRAIAATKSLFHGIYRGPATYPSDELFGAFVDALAAASARKE